MFARTVILQSNVNTCTVHVLIIAAILQCIYGEMGHCSSNCWLVGLSMLLHCPSFLNTGRSTRNIQLVTSIVAVAPSRIMSNLSAAYATTCRPHKSR